MPRYLVKPRSTDYKTKFSPFSIDALSKTDFATKATRYAISHFIYSCRVDVVVTDEAGNELEKFSYHLQGATYPEKWKDIKKLASYAFSLSKKEARKSNLPHLRSRGASLSFYDESGEPVCELNYSERPLPKSLREYRELLKEVGEKRPNARYVMLNVVVDAAQSPYHMSVDDYLTRAGDVSLLLNELDQDTFHGL